MDRVSRFVRAVWVAGLLSLVLAVGAGPAWGAFQGRDGDLVVATGRGLELVAPGTAAASPICTEVVLCGHPAQPAFSPNGRAIAFVDTASGRPVVIAPDGPCLWCLIGAPLTRRTGSEPAFTPGGQGVTVVGNGLWSVSLTGGRARRLLHGRVDGATWSSRGLVAVVRSGWIWVGRPGHGRLRRLARGRSPSFSPDASRLALARGGYVWIVRIANRSERRLVRGGEPAWSPSGRRIAYIAPSGAVKIVDVRGGLPHQVGSVQGTALDWQPLPSSERQTCRPPRGSTVVASNREAVVWFSQSFDLVGCLKALGRTRVLGGGSHYELLAVRLAGRFAALAAYTPDAITTATLVDLGSGKATTLATSPFHSLDSLTLDSSGFAAWRQTPRPEPQPIAAISCPSASLCVAGDDGGNILSSTNPTGGASAWRKTKVDTASDIPFLGPVSCPSVSLCVAVDINGNILSSTDPTGGNSAWRRTKIRSGSTTGEGSALDALSCPSVSLCVTGDADGHIFTSTDPTGPASAWRRTNVALDAVSCPSVSLCVGTTGGADVVTSTNPTGGASAWTKAKIYTGAAGPLNSAVSCPSVSLCVAVHSDGNIFSSTDPTGGASAWTKARIDLEGALGVSVSCPSVSLCVAVDSDGNIFTSTDPTGGASTWTKARIDLEGALGVSVSCPSVSLCVAVGAGIILSSTDPTGGADAWTRAVVDIPGCATQSYPCISERLLVRDDQGTRVVDTAPPGQGNSIGNVALASLALSWTHDGAQRQLQLR